MTREQCQQIADRLVALGIERPAIHESILPAGEFGLSWPTMLSEEQRKLILGVVAEFWQPPPSMSDLDRYRLR